MLEYTVSFVTPAFLGNAEQSGQWRTPPFKALLRQWWRVAYAADHDFRVNLAEMRRDEGRLFGHAWLEDDRDESGQKVTARKSLVRIRLDRWNKGRLGSWQGLEQKTVYHPEAEKANFQIGPHAYLGYGPLDARGGTRFEKRNAAIQAGESAPFSVAFPGIHRHGDLTRLLDENTPRVACALWLMDRYGTAGGRSRNGWGSFSLTPVNGTPALAGNLPLRPWSEALGLEWPHAVGRDESGALIWQTKPFEDWKQLMRELAIIKIGLRTQFMFPNSKPPHPNVELRHWLSYPITTHTTRAWERGARLPNSLRFKVRPDPNDPKKLVGVIPHIPCRPPAAFHPDIRAITQMWQTVHALLDELARPAQSRAYHSISDPDRRARLKLQLDTVTLTRIAE